MTSHKYCPFCLSEHKKLPQHVASPVQVESWLNTEEKEDKKKELALMRNYGNFSTQLVCTTTGKRQAHCGHRPKYHVDPEYYLPCQHCFGYYVKSDLWKHKCCQRRDGGRSDEPSSKKKKRTLHCKPGQMLLPSTSGVCGRTNEILAKMHWDDISRLVKSDKLIKMFAEKLTMKHGHSRDHE